jgi:hypothetical protein
VRIDAEPDSTDDVAMELDRERIVFVSHIAANERLRVVDRVWVRDRRDPVRDLRVVAPCDERRHVVLRPRPQP